MKIAFLTSGLEPGQDGVGDYARRLAGACCALGHPASLVALNDPFVSAVAERVERIEGQNVPVQRLPASVPWQRRVAAARSFIASQSPDWTSLQLVPYGFHGKGIILGQISHLATLSSGTRAHVMMHELWIGADPRSRFRDRAVGAVQRYGVQRLLSALRPSVVHTSNPAYAALITTAGWSAEILPLFGNIPVAPPAGREWLAAQLPPGPWAEELARSRQAFWVFLVFGSIHPQWSPDTLLPKLGEAARQTQRRIVVISAGRVGPGEGVWRDASSRYGGQFLFATLGPRSDADVSRLMQEADFGVSTTPWQLVGKSGTAAAMIDHGLPVIVTRDDVRILPKGARQAQSPLLHLLDAESTGWLPSASRTNPRPRLAEISRDFLKTLEGHESG